MNRKTVSIFLFVFAILLLGAMIPSRIAITTSPSLEKRIFFVLRNAPIQDVKRNQYVMVDLRKIGLSREISDEVQSAGTQERATRVIKRVSCRAGDLLESRGNEYFCNGIHIGTAKDKMLNGNETVKFQYSSAIPSGYLFITGDHIDSFDSKYFGLVPESKIESVLFSIL